MPQAGDIVYVLPPRFAILGEALASLERRLRMAMDQSVAPIGHELVMPESLSHHLGVIQRVLGRLSARVEGLISENAPGGESETAQIYIAVGRLEEAFSGWVDGYQDLKASHASPEVSEARRLLLAVYRHHLVEVCDWLANLVKIIDDPAVAMRELKLRMGEGATLTFSLTVTVSSEMDQLMAIANRIQIERPSEIESSSPAKSPMQSGPGVLGTIGALAIGFGVTKAVLGSNRG
jgi:hypothetical protein